MDIKKEIKAIPKIKEIHIKNEGVIEEAKINFVDGLNVITGINGSGKTTVLKAIEKQASECWTLKELERIGAFSDKILLTITGIHQTLFNKCFLIDDILDRLSDDKAKLLLSELENTKNQIIMTMRKECLPDIKANIIDTKDFKLKNK